MRVGVLASGEGTNLQALLDTVHGREAEIVAVASDQPSARALERARAAGVPVASVPDRASSPTAARATPRSPAGSTSTAWSSSCWRATWPSCTTTFLERFAGRLINVHPSLLPAFPGLRAIEQALEYGVKVLRGDRPLRRARRRRRRPDHPAGLRSSCPTRPTRPRSSPRCGRSSTRCCRGPWRSSPPAPCAATRITRGACASTSVRAGAAGRVRPVGGRRQRSRSARPPRPPPRPRGHRSSRGVLAAGVVVLSSQSPATSSAGSSASSLRAFSSLLGVVDVVIEPLEPLLELVTGALEVAIRLGGAVVHVVSCRS